MITLSELKLHGYKCLEEEIDETGNVPHQFRVINWPLNEYPEELWKQLIKQGFVVSTVVHDHLIDVTWNGDKLWERDFN